MPLARREGHYSQIAAHRPGPALKPSAEQFHRLLGSWDGLPVTLKARLPCSECDYNDNFDYLERQDCTIRATIISDHWQAHDPAIVITIEVLLDPEKISTPKI